MVASPVHPRTDSTSYLQNILDTPEHPELRRLTSLVEQLFRVPVAYIALLGASDEVVARIGSGAEYIPYLRRVRLDRLFDEPQVVRDAACDLPPGTDFADLRFAASAPLLSSGGVRLGVLVIADRLARPGFSQADIRTLAELAGVLAARMELRMFASLAVESELAEHEAERYFRSIVHHAPVPLLYSGVNGACEFVNKTWLKFSGRKLEEELGSGWAGLIHPDFRDNLLREYWSGLETLRPWKAEAPFLRHDGQYRWMRDKGSPRFREDGSFAGFVGCLLDLEKAAPPVVGNPG